MFPASRACKRTACLMFLVSAFLAVSAIADEDSESYTLAQAADGREVYNRECAVCHGLALEGSEAGVALSGSAFRQKWIDQSTRAFFALLQETMPLNRPAALSSTEYATVTAYILNRNGFTAGNQPLDVNGTDMNGFAFRGKRERSPTALPSSSQKRGGMVEWLHHRADAGSTNYSPLALINRDNVANLKVAWRWHSDNFGSTLWSNLQSTPIMARGVLYATAGARRVVVAIDATSGETLWMYRLDEGERGENAPRRGPGRGVAYHRQDQDETVYAITPGYRLVALDAKTGLPHLGFGDEGVVDLKVNIDQEIDTSSAQIGASSPPIVVNNVVIVGSAFPAGGAPPKKEMAVGHVTGYDATTGKRLWIFHTIPQPGQYGHKTWLNDSWTYTGNTGVWAPMSADHQLGYVYLPVEAPTGDFYGGHRPGDNLYSQSLVCIDVATGKRVWHFQTVHHGIWDFDLPAPPVLLNVTVDGRQIPAVAQVTKQGFVFVFDRRDGTPVWPIEERPVPQSTVPGEHTAATQPFPSLPEPFEAQGISADRLNNLTPEIFEEARRITENYRLGPLYTPPSVKNKNSRGTLYSPSAVGGANWQGAVADAVSGILYVPSTTSVGAIGLVSDPERSNMNYVAQRQKVIGPFGLPLLRPPWGRITALDLNTGKKLWVIANGDTPQWIRNHPRLQGISLPRTGHEERAGLLVTGSLLFAGEGAGLYMTTASGTKFRAHDKLTGEIVTELDLGLRQSGMPMTYMINNRQYIVVPAGAPNHGGQFIALVVDGDE